MALGQQRLVLAVQAAPGHRFPGHPECPERVLSVEAALERVLQGCPPGQVERLGMPPPLPDGLLESVHTSEHLAALAATSAAVTEPTAVRDPDDPDGPTFATPTSYADALAAAGAAVALLDAVVTGCSCSSSRAQGSAGGSNAAAGDGVAAPPAAGSVHAAPAAGVAEAASESQAAAAAAQPTMGLSVCRPPGHHATPGDQMGFCLLNNAALAARHAQRAHGLGRVLILDWDVHHGNGTQDVFVADPSVMLIDVHQQDVWPGSGGEGETGEGLGTGATLNVPLPWYCGHEAAQRVWQQVVAPAARRFKPDLIIVSAGYDAHWQDPLEHLQFQCGTFHWLGAAVLALARELCCGRLLLLLEGGYNQQALGESVAETVLALLGRPSVHPLLPPEQLPHPEPLEQVDALVERLRRQHALEWKECIAATLLGAVPPTPLFPATVRSPEGRV